MTIRSGALLGRRTVIKTVATFGRAADSTVVLEDNQVSREHARIERGPDGRFYLVDGGSRNGTYLNDARVDLSPLEFGDRIRIGNTSMTFEPHDELEQQKIQLHRFELLGRLTAGVVHDLNNALCVVSASVAFLREASQSVSRDEVECLEDIEVATDRATQLARQLVSFARGEGNTPRRVDLAGLCNEVVKLAQRTFPQSIELSAHLTPGLVVEAEPAHLHQILMNLCVNARDAIHAAGHSGSIVVRTRAASGAEDGGWVTLTVEDDGIGMDRATRLRVFEPFFTTKAAGRGSGLGLATAADLVRRMGGTIDVDSRPGSGSRFTLRLPVSAGGALARPAPATSTSAQWAPRGSRTGRVLIVDDDAGVRRSFARVLRRAGFETLEASDGQAALDALRAASPPPDLVLLDLDMPRMGGEEALVRMLELRSSLPVLIVSGETRPETLVQVRARGARGVVCKPCAPSELLAYVVGALDSMDRDLDEETHF